MKKLLVTLSFIFLSSIYVSGQTTFTTAYELVDSLRNEFNPSKTYVVQSKKDPTKKDTFNNKYVPFPSLNVFFNNQVNRYLSSSGEVSLSRVYGVLSNEDKRLQLGVNLNIGQKKFKYLRSILGVGLNLDTKDGFGNIIGIEKGTNVFSDNIGLDIKWTWLKAGTITPDKPKESKNYEALQSYRSDYFKYLEKEIIDKAEIKVVGHKGSNDSLLADQLDELYKEYKLALSKKEAGLLVEKNLIRNSNKSWLSVSGYVPLTPSKYVLAPSIGSAFLLDTVGYFPAKAEISLNHLWVHGKTSVHVRTHFGINYNNSVKTKKITKYSFNQYRNQGGNDTLNLAEIDENDVYVGSFNQFVTFNYGAELTIFPHQKYVGISASIERYFGAPAFSGWNFAFGVPISVNDKDGKQKINFEPQYRRVLSKDFIGISIGLPFGSIIHK